MDRGDDSPAVEGHDRQQVEEVDEEAEERYRLQAVRVFGRAHHVDGEGAERAEERPGDCELELAPGALGMLLQEDARAEEGEKEGRVEGRPWALARERWPHLVEKDHPDEPGRKPDPAVPEVGP